MSAIGVLGVFGRNDMRQIRRDSMLVGVFAGPLIYAAALWFVPALTRYAVRAWDVDLTPYYSLIVSAAAVIGPALVIGSLAGLLLLEEKDQRTLSALRVTPLPPSAYPLYRGLVTVALATVYTVAVLALSRLASAEVILAGVPVGVTCGMVAIVVSLLIAGPAGNKVEGLAIGKAIGLPFAIIPMGAFFLTGSPWEAAFGVLPPYWPAKALWSAWEGGTIWPYVLGGLAYNTLLIAVLLRLFRGRLG
ncbi:MAG: ABC transporter permease [Streptosporangiales bacterium]|nr:ABC transporter permease [Streptosporangiales bacterium]